MKVLSVSHVKLREVELDDGTILCTVEPMEDPSIPTDEEMQLMFEADQQADGMHCCGATEFEV